MNLKLMTRIEICNDETVLVLNLHPNLYYMFMKEWDNIKDMNKEDLENTPFYTEVMSTVNAGNNTEIEYIVNNTNNKEIVFTIPYKELARLSKDYGIHTIFLDNNLVFGSKG